MGRPEHGGMLDAGGDEMWMAAHSIDHAADRHIVALRSATGENDFVRVFRTDQRGNLFTGLVDVFFHAATKGVHA